MAHNFVTDSLVSSIQKELRDLCIDEVGLCSRVFSGQLLIPSIPYAGFHLIEAIHNFGFGVMVFPTLDCNLDVYLVKS